MLQLDKQVKNSTSGARKWLETSLILGGVLMLVGFALFKGWSANERQAGLDAFEAARGESLPPIETAFVELEGPAEPARPIALETNNNPDTSLWSAGRVEEYRQAVSASDSAPEAVLTIDHLNIRVPVYNGADDLNLNRGVARILGTAKIGEKGNLGIAGHRDSFFRPLQDIKVGDHFRLETYTGTQQFRVSSIEIVESTELRVLAPTDTATVTLVTCYPFYYVGHAPQRFIVKGEVLNHQVNS